MSKGTQSFNRFEFKYWIEHSDKERFIRYLLNFMEFDKNNSDGKPYQICSLYLDTQELDCYQDKFNGNSFRRKYRIRTYNHNYHKLFFEVKEKNNIFVRKKRKTFILDDERVTDIPELLCSGASDQDEGWLFNHAYRHLNLRPTCWVAYKRLALVGRHNPGLRVTFDNDLSGSRAHDFRLRHGTLRSVHWSRWRRPTILEIKFNQYLPYWLEKELGALNLMHESISKYGIVIAKFNFQDWKEKAWIH